MGERRRPAVVLVHPVPHSGLPHEPSKTAVRDLGFAVVSVYMFAPGTAVDLSEHEKGDDLSLYTHDCEDVVRRLADEDFDVQAVVPSTERGVHLADLVAERLGVPGNRATLAWARRSKSAMRAHAVEAGVRIPDFRLVHTKAEIAESARELGFPAIVKPTLGAGSQGVTLLPDEDALGDLSGLPDHDLHGNPIEEWLVEEYIQGRELVVNFYTAQDEHRLVDIWDYRRPDDRPYDFPLWDIIQIGTHDPDYERVDQFVREVLDAYGIRRGPSHIEVKCNDKGVYLIEIAARLGGGPAQSMWAKYGGMRPLHYAIECYLDRRPEWHDQPVGFPEVFGSVVILNEGPPGTLVAVHGLEQVQQLTGLDELQLGYQPGEHVPTTRHAFSVPFSASVHGPDETSVLGTMKTIRSLITLEIEPDAVPDEEA